jgi:hypothetical protein
MVIHEVLLEQGAGGLAVRRVRLRDRVRARLRTATLDRQLADGAPPEANVALALHATRVYEPGQRLLLARSLRRIADSSNSQPGRIGVPLNREAIVRARPEIDAVADRLRTDGPVSVRGVARIRLLLTDGSGPLYGASRPEQLRRELQSALVAFDLAS